MSCGQYSRLDLCARMPAIAKPEAQCLPRYSAVICANTTGSSQRGTNIRRRRPMAFRCPISRPGGRRAQRTCDHEAQRFGSRVPHRMLPPFGGEGRSDGWQKSCGRIGSDPLESRRHGCNGSRTVWNCRQKSTRSHHACPRRTTTLGCDARRLAVKGLFTGRPGLKVPGARSDGSGSRHRRPPDRKRAPATPRIAPCLCQA